VRGASLINTSTISFDLSLFIDAMDYGAKSPEKDKDSTRDGALELRSINFTAQGWKLENAGRNKMHQSRERYCMRTYRSEEGSKEAERETKKKVEREKTIADCEEA